MKKDSYIGERKIRSAIVDTEDDTLVNVTFKDNTTIVLKQKLFDLVKKEEKGNGSPTDAMQAYIAGEFLIKMGDYGLDLLDLQGLSNSINALAHNLKESKIGEKFGVSGPLMIKVSDIIK